MGIFDFFKPKKEEPKKEKIAFEELGNWISRAKEKNRQEGEQVIEIILGKTAGLAEDLKAKKEVLEKIDLKERKAEERLKRIVLENLANYSYQLSKLIENLNKLEKEELESLIKDIDALFLDFRKKSSLSYEKATILIGKELGAVKDTIGLFFKELNEILEENKNIIRLSKSLDSSENNFYEIEKEKKLRGSIIEEIKSIEEKIAKLESESNSARNKLEEKKKSAEYLEQENEKNQAKIRKEELAKEISQLRQMIDFKSLAKNYHTDTKKIKVIKEYEYDFNKILEKEGENELLSLINEADKKAVQEKIREINEKKRQIQEMMSRKDGLEEIAHEIIKITSDLKSLNSEKIREDKRIEKIEDNIKTLKEIIKKEMLAIGVEAE